MEIFDKPFTSIEEQIKLLSSRKLIIENENDVEQKLLKNNYYTIVNGYKDPFLKKDINNPEKPIEPEEYLEGTSFNELYALYEFDCQFRALLLKYILQVEHQLKSVIAHIFARNNPDVEYPRYLAQEYFDPVISKSERKKSIFDKMIAHIKQEIEHQYENLNPMLIHYQEKHKNIPPWILVSFLSFGMIRSFYSCLDNQMKNDISRTFNLYPHELDMYLSALNIYRNSCAHNERIYNLKLKNKVVRQNSYREKKEYNKVYVVILILKDMLDAASFMSFYSEFDECVNKLSNNLKTISILDIYSTMGMPLNPTVVKDQLGPLEKGDILSLEEFKNVLTRYILPIISLPVAVQQVCDTDENRCNPKCLLVENKNNILYFAQSKVGNYSHCIPLLHFKVSNDTISVIEENLSVFINYLHIFWDLNNISMYGQDNVEIAFPKICEQAYELTICNLICRKSERSIIQRSLKLKEQYKRECGTASQEILNKLLEEIASSKDEYNSIIRSEALAQQSLYKILLQIEVWASKTYEGQHKNFGIIFNKAEMPSCQISTFNYIEFLKSDFSATINDGVYSAIELYSDGSYKAHCTISRSIDDTLSSVPYPFTGFAELCTIDKIGIILTDTGDIYIINNKKLCYTKHNGTWLYCNSEKIKERIMEEIHIEANQAEIINQTITDLSYSRGGACIAIIPNDAMEGKLTEMIKGGLLTNADLDMKSLAIKKLISNLENDKSKNFYELDRHLRRELLELDGATVISANGCIHVIGTIIKLNGSGSAGGGRTAAATQLSEHGLAIKISQDGYIQLFKSREKILEILA